MSWFGKLACGLGVISNIQNRCQSKRILRKADRENEKNKGIVEYRKGSIESFVELAGPTSNFIYSGGDASFRRRAIAHIVVQSYAQKKGVIVLHVGNSLLEQEVNSVAAHNKIGLTVINKNNPIYDPFFKLSNFEIASLMERSAPDHIKITNNVRDYVEGLSEYMRLSKLDTTFHHFKITNYQGVRKNVEKAAYQNTIPQSNATSIIAQMLKGEPEINSIKSYFYDLWSQGNQILRNGGNTIYNLFEAVKDNYVIMIDVTSPSNSFLLDVLGLEMERLIANNYHINIITEGIPYSSSKVLRRLIKSSSISHNFAYMNQDVVSDFFGFENEFTSFIGKAESLFVSRHMAATSAQKMSDVLGSYDKQELTNTVVPRGGLFNLSPFAQAPTGQLSRKTEPKVRPEEITGMSDNQIYGLSINHDGIISATVE